MSQTNPPNPFPLNPIFNYSDWIINLEYLTINIANGLYLKKAGDSATGLINFNVGLTCSNLCNISCNVLLNGVLGTDRQITASYLNLTNANDNTASTQIFSNFGTIYYDNNTNSGSHIFATNNSSGVQSLTLQLNSLDMTIQTTNPPTCNAVQPLFTDSSTKIPTTAWVQSAITNTPSVQKTYTLQYTTNTSITLPTNCIGISVRCIGRGGASGNAFDNNGGTWNAGGAGSGGTTITNNGIIPFTAGHILQINFNFYTEILSTTLGVSVCRASAGANGSNATSGGGGLGGISNNPFTTNNNICSWSALYGSNGLNGGTNLNFQSSQYPATGGTPICQLWNASTVYGAGQNWNGFITLNSFQGPAINILGGICFITYYLK